MSKKFTGSLMEPMFYANRKPEYLDTRMETTLVMSAIRSSILLTHLRMSGSACDEILKCVSEMCGNLKSLDISESYVSDWGFYYLCGLAEKERKNVRACKRSARETTRKLEKLQPGCENLTHLVANNLKSINWSPRKYLDIGQQSDYASNATLPQDCGFVMALKYLTRLKVFLTQVGGNFFKLSICLHF